ncbi:DUF3846 domain-containing protein [Muribaculaceae bacterium Isolate-007 (NCI)]|nr:DUF3846 domain-containing protein [Muribaculaceae bacterium Isolate-100 (HZI)]RXE66308.1 DUF3846 domain-containing protein [Muribaculaceae bacterium Isolate-007 (NCI)]
MELLPDKAYLIKENGKICQITPGNGTDFVLEEAQAYVAGFIEIVRLNELQIMIVNEEGKFVKGHNIFATAIANLNKAIRCNDYIAGDAVICPTAMLR